MERYTRATMQELIRQNELELKAQLVSRLLANGHITEADVHWIEKWEAEWKARQEDGRSRGTGASEESARAEGRHGV